MDFGSLEGDRHTLSVPSDHMNTYLAKPNTLVKFAQTDRTMQRFGVGSTFRLKGLSTWDYYVAVNAVNSKDVHIIEGSQIPTVRITK